MKKVSVKKQLVDRMIAKGNNFTYTEMIKETLRICRGEDYVYDPKSSDRGFYATNFSQTCNGYMVNGGGDCGVYKNFEGKWSAKYYTEQEKMDTFITMKFKVMHRLLEMYRTDYERIKMEVEEDYGGSDKLRIMSMFRQEYNRETNRIKRDTKNQILRKIFTKK